jgi:hypothetical protein
VEPVKAIAMLYVYATNEEANVRSEVGDDCQMSGHDDGHGQLLARRKYLGLQSEC